MIRPLSPKQAAVAALVAQGWTYTTIGAQLGLSRRTVEHYVEMISDKIDGSEVEYGIPPYRRVHRWALLTLPQEIRS